MKAIEIKHLDKVYEGKIHAVNDISLTLAQGEIFGVLGPNGAGKTTLVKLLTGMLQATAGQASVLGFDPSVEPEKIHRIAGVMTEHAGMYDHLTGLENLLFYGELFGLDKKTRTDKAKKILNQLELADSMNQKLATYSTGMRQRLSLGRALVHDPKVLFLDEPTSGLDPESVLQVNQMIQDLARNRGITIFLCTHQLRYAQNLCTRFGLIAKGKLLAQGDLCELRQQAGFKDVLQLTADNLNTALPFRKIADQQYELTINSLAEIPDIITQLVQNGTKIYQVQQKEVSLEEIYFELTRKEALNDESHH